jgi:hypothetical protein
MGIIIFQLPSFHNLLAIFKTSLTLQTLETSFENIKFVKNTYIQPFKQREKKEGHLI